MRLVSAIALCLCTAAVPAAAAEQPGAPPCGSVGPSAAPSADIIMPGGDPFSPPLAGAGEPRVSLAYVWTSLVGLPAASGSGVSDFAAGVVSGGTVFGLWGRDGACDDVQVSLIGGVFSQFNMDTPSQALINSDFLIGGQVTHRRGRVSTRVRVYHQSSHLGDEFLLRNPHVARVDFGFEAVDVLLSLDGPRWRAYAGGGLRVFSHGDLAPGVLRGGLEGGQRPTRGRRPRLVAGLDLTAHQARNWRTAVSGTGGLEWSGSSNTHRMRALVFAFSGPAPWGQFFDERMRHGGVQLQFEY